MKPIPFLLCLLLANTLYSKTITVTTTYDELHFPVGSNISIREAIRDAAAGDEIFIPNGVYYLTNPFGPFAIDKDLAIRGESKELTIIDGRNRYQLFNARFNALSVQNLTLQNGKIGNLDGRNFCPSECGGAILAGRKLFVKNCLFKNNQAANGGSIHMSGDTKNEIINCEFIDNIAAVGGACRVSSNEVLFKNCLFKHNNALTNGGCIQFSFTSKVTVVQSKFLANISKTGAVIRAGSGELTIIQCLMSGNSTSISGGAIYLNGNVNATIIQSTISGNKSDSDENGIGVGDAIRVFRGQLNIANSIIAMNDDNSNNINIDQDGILNDLGGNLIAIDPLFKKNVPFAPSEEGDLSLQSISPAINKGVNANLPKDDFDFDNDFNLSELLPVDLQNNLRIKDARVDAGAFEQSLNIIIPTFSEWTLLVYALIILNIGLYFLNKKYA